MSSNNDAHTSDDAPRVGHANESEIKEYFDDEGAVRAFAKSLAELIRSSKHVVAYTGAGISTAAKIPDYRGPTGVWTLKEHGVARGPGKLNLAQAVPTFAHAALTLLYQKGLLKFVVSTNVDGLHRRSGLAKEGLAELHGNCYKEFCDKCGHEYLRDYDCTARGCRKDHTTGRKCEQKDCDGQLLDSIIHFGENLPDSELDPAVDHSKKADLAVVLGTSMRVTPACNLPLMCNKLVICNLQNTNHEKRAVINVHAPTDVMMHMLMEELGLINEIPTETPEGYPIQRPGPYNSQELREKAQQQMDQLRNNNNPVVRTGEVAATAQKLGNLRLGTQAKPVTTVEGKNGETSSIAANRPNELLFVRACSGCTFTITNSVTKLIIERVQSSTIYINATVLTGTCEVISCQQLNIIFNKYVPTITVDKSTDCTLEFKDVNDTRGPSQFIWSACSDLKFKINSKVHLIPAAQTLRPEVDPEFAQFRSRFAGGSVVSELLIREGAGYATTEREKAANDARAERNQVAFERMLASTFSTSSLPPRKQEE